MIRNLLLFAVGAFALSLAPAVAEDKKEEKVPTVSEIMKKGHAGTMSFKAKIETSVKAEKWDDAKTPSDLLKAFGDDLGKNKVKKGDEDSWKKLTAGYAKITADISAGVEKKDAKATTAALGALGKSCKECHSVHK